MCQYSWDYTINHNENEVKQFMKELNNTEAESKKSIAYKRKRVSAM